MKAELKAVRRLGKRIKEIRQAKKMSQLRLATEVDVEQSYISRIEGGTISPSFPTLYLIAKHLGVKLSELVQDID